MNETGPEQPVTESAQDSGKEDLRPYAEVTSIRTVVRDGWYNAFTDLISWKDYFWLAYRRGLGHHGERTTVAESGNSFSVILRSGDLRRWHEAQVFEPPLGIVDGSGVGQCHFCSTGERLYAFFPVQTPGASGCIWRSWTADGVRWSEPEALTLGDYHPYTWRVRWHEGRFYSAICYLEHEEGPLDLIVSDDGIHWSKYAEIAAFSPHKFTEETELYWRSDGELWCVARSWGPALLYWSRPPYTEWHEGVLLPAGCDAPVICETDDEVYLAGRCSMWQQEPDPGGAKTFNTFNHAESPFARSGTTGLYLLRRDNAQLLVTFPPGADASYCGLVSVEPGKLIMSYYSDVAYISEQVRPMHYPEYRYKRSECDIYIAEIEVGEHPAPVWYGRPSDIKIVD